MYKRVQNNFVNSVIRAIVSANRLAACKKIYASKLKELKPYQMPKVKIYQMPKLTLVGTTVTAIESDKQIDSDSNIQNANQGYIVNMIFNLQGLGNTTIIYHTTKPNQITYTSDSLNEFLDCDFKDDHPDLLFTNTNVNDLAKRIVTHFTGLQELGGTDSAKRLRVQSTFVNTVINSILAMKRFDRSQGNLWQMPKLTLVSTSVNEIKSDKTAKPSQSAYFTSADYIGRMIFDLGKNEQVKVTYNTLKPYQIFICDPIYTDDDILKHGVGRDFAFKDKDDRPGLLFIDTQLDVIANRIVKRYAHLQKETRKAK